MPDQVIVNVHVALRDQGYYAGVTDGVMVPETRAALAVYQADHDLAVTSAIDSNIAVRLSIVRRDVVHFSSSGHASRK